MRKEKRNIERGKGMKHETYVVTFLYIQPGLHQFLLVVKKRPAWQAGMLNGIGGKCEAGETIEGAAYREVYEEARITKSQIPGGLRQRVVLHELCFGVTIHFFSGLVSSLVAKMAVEQSERLAAADPEREIIIRGYISDLYASGEEKSPVVTAHFKGKAIRNLRWLIPLCRDENAVLPIQITERQPF